MLGSCSAPRLPSSLRDYVECEVPKNRWPTEAHCPSRYSRLSFSTVVIAPLLFRPGFQDDAQYCLRNVLERRPRHDFKTTNLGVWINIEPFANICHRCDEMNFVHSRRRRK